MRNFQYSIVSDPEIFQENRMEAHSDHEFFSNEDAVFDGISDFKYFLNGVWKFSYAKNYDSAIKNFYEMDYDCHSWDEIRVPAHIQMEGYGVPQYANTQYPWEGQDNPRPGEIPTYFNPVASYVKYFTVPESMTEGPVYISFQGVESGMALWLNGQYIGYSEDTFTPSEFDLTDYVINGENKLAVRVFKWTAGSWCEDQDFFRFSGIFRDVYLY
ncbi:MAG: beta-galactosidase, partial [Lachnospiraceae bacterium]|nr:beta-galactosidase [Lachnospiraceae bacterium]